MIHLKLNDKVTICGLTLKAPVWPDIAEVSMDATCAACRAVSSSVEFSDTSVSANTKPQSELATPSPKDTEDQLAAILDAAQWYIGDYGRMDNKGGERKEAAKVALRKLLADEANKTLDLHLNDGASLHWKGEHYRILTDKSLAKEVLAARIDEVENHPTKTNNRWRDDRLAALQKEASDE